MPKTQGECRVLRACRRWNVLCGAVHHRLHHSTQEIYLMRNMRVFALALFSAGCASAGGVFPEAGDGASAIANAERQIAAAQQAGADSLAAEVLNSARQHVAVGK